MKSKYLKISGLKAVLPDIRAMLLEYQQSLARGTNRNSEIQAIPEDVSELVSAGENAADTATALIQQIENDYINGRGALGKQCLTAILRGYFSLSSIASVIIINMVTADNVFISITNKDVIRAFSVTSNLSGLLGGLYVTYIRYGQYYQSIGLLGDANVHVQELRETLSSTRDLHLAANDAREAPLITQASMFDSSERMQAFLRYTKKAIDTYALPDQQKTENNRESQTTTVQIPEYFQHISEESNATELTPLRRNAGSSAFTFTDTIGSLDDGEPTPEPTELPTYSVGFQQADTSWQ